MPREPESLSHPHAKCPEGRSLTKKTEWLKGPFRLVLIIIYFSYLRQTLAHPQCLDYQPPFKPPYHLEFCRHYEKFGCCDQKADNSIAMRYWDIMDLIGDEAYAVCGDLVKDIMCQVCMIFYWQISCIFLCCFLNVVKYLSVRRYLTSWTFIFILYNITQQLEKFIVSWITLYCISLLSCICPFLSYIKQLIPYLQYKGCN